MKRRIVAIGGGRVRVPQGREPQTLELDQEIVRLSGRKNPRLLFIPTASADDLDYCQAIERLYGQRLGCHVDHLLLFKDRPVKQQINNKILASDIIYVGGGNTLRMMKLWRRLGVDRLLDKARLKGAVLCGLSAGAICWFRQGNSDSRKFSDASNRSLIKVRGLGFSDLMLCPHYDVEKHRQPALKQMMQQTRGVAVALDNCAALEIIDDQFQVLTSRQHKNAWRIYWQRGEYYKERLNKNDGFRPLRELLEI